MWPLPQGRCYPSLGEGVHHIAGGAGRLNSFSQCEIGRSVLHGKPVLELPCPISDHVITCLEPLAPLKLRPYGAIQMCILLLLLLLLGPALCKLAGCNCGTL